MKPPKISSWDWPDQHQEPDGYDLRSVPDATPRNLEFLAEKFNELIDSLNEEDEL